MCFWERIIRESQHLWDKSTTRTKKIDTTSNPKP